MSSTVVRDTDTTAPDRLAVSSREQLVALRNTFDERLDALERALLDPSQASSLVPLVLALTRVATDEAAAVARQACLETQLEAHRAAAATGVADRQTITDLRLSVGELQTKLERLRADLSGEQQQVAEARSAAEHRRGHLASLESRVAAAEERAEEAAGTVRTLTEERKRLASSLAELQAEVAAARRDAEAAVAKERTDGTAVRQSLGEAKAQLDRSIAELDNERQALAAAKRAVEDGRARIAAVEAELAAAAEGRQADARRFSDELRAAESARAAAVASPTRAAKTPAVGRKAGRRELEAALPEVDASPAELAFCTSAPPTAVSEAAPTRARAKTHKAAPVQAGLTVADALRQWTAEDASESPPVAATPAAETSQPTYWNNAVRQDPRHSLSDRDVQIQVDGERAQLVDLSANGAQVVTSKALKPGHQVRVSLPSGSGQTVAKAKVAWSRLEPGGCGLQYRAGLAFTTIDPKAIAFLIDEAAPAACVVPQRSTAV